MRKQDLEYLDLAFFMKNSLIPVWYSQKTIPSFNEVWYFAPEQVTLYSNIGITEHTFADGKGVIKFSAPVTTMGQAFRLVTTITEIRLPECVKTIGDSAFVNGQMTKINIDNVTSIERSAFQGCAKLVLDSLPPGLETIGNGAFNSCRALGLSTLPNSVTSIGNSAFRSSGVAFTSLPSGLEYIGSNAFQSTGCSFKEIPASVKSIGASAFVALNMPELTFLGTPQSISDDTFKQLSTLQIIRVTWSEGEVDGAPWGAINATIIYNYSV